MVDFDYRLLRSSALLGGRLGSLLAQMSFENDGISGIRFVYCIGKITNERDEANNEVEYHINQHLHA